MESKNLSVKEKIKRATADLLNKKSYMDITVTDISKTADIARVSFYRNYNSVADVFDDIVEDVFKEIIKDIVPVLTGNDKKAWREFLFGMFRNFPKHHSVTKSKIPENENLFFSKLSEKFQKTKMENDISDRMKKYIAFGKTGLVVSIIKRWMADGKKESPEEMVDFIMTFITNF